MSEALLSQAKAIIAGSTNDQDTLMKFTSALAVAFKEDDSITSRDDVLEAFRIACRNESCALHFEKEEEAMHKLMGLSALACEKTLPHPEAAKAVLNILYHSEIVRKSLINEGVLGKFIDALLKVNDSSPDLFWRLRFLFLCTIELSGAKVASDRAELTKHLLSLSTLMIKKPSVHSGCLAEILRSLYNISNSTASWDKDVELQILEQIENYLSLNGATGEVVALKTDAITLILTFSDESLKNSPLLKSDKADNIILLLNEMTCLPEEISAKVHTHGTLLAVAKLAELNPQLRKNLRKKLFPSKWDRSLKPEEGESIKSRIVRLLRSNDAHIIAATGKLILTLCSGNVGRFVYHVGYGNSAGFLFNNGMLGKYQADIDALKCRDNLDLSSDEDAMTNDQTAGINPVTGAEDSEMAPAGADMTEEEKEAERDRLIDLFERLEKTGVMKVMPRQ